MGSGDPLVVSIDVRNPSGTPQAYTITMTVTSPTGKIVYNTIETRTVAGGAGQTLSFDAGRIDCSYPNGEYTAKVEIERGGL